jgi:hypothetical protein
VSKQLLAFVGDLHAGSTVGLCGPDPIELDDGQGYTPSKAQLWLWQCWRDFWGVVAERLQHASFHSLIVNGDAVDGDHHNTRQIISRDVGVHIRVAVHALEVGLALKPEHAFVVRGTESHVGHSGSAEEAIARILRAEGHPVQKEPDTGANSWWHLRMDVNGLLIDAAHHGRSGHREHTRGNAANLYAHDILLAHVKYGDRVPGLCVRSHYHKWLDSGDAAKVLRLIGMPAWQLATGFVHRVAPDSLADIGGLIVEVEEDGSYEVHKVKFQPDRGTVWKRESA